MDASPVKGKYDTAVDAESAYEMLQKRIADTAGHRADGAPRLVSGGILGQLGLDRRHASSAPTASADGCRPAR